MHWYDWKGHIIKGNQYKTLIKSKLHDEAFQFVLEVQQHHNKVKHIKYDELKINSYLCSPIFSRKEKSTLFSLLSRTIPGTRNDFGDKYGTNKSLCVLQMCTWCSGQSQTIALMTTKTLKILKTLQINLKTQSCK